MFWCTGVLSLLCWVAKVTKPENNLKVEGSGSPSKFLLYHNQNCDYCQCFQSHYIEFQLISQSVKHGLYPCQVVGIKRPASKGQSTGRPDWRKALDVLGL